MRPPDIGPSRWESHLRALARTRQDAPPAAAPAAFTRWTTDRAPAPAPPDAALDDALWWGVLDTAIDPLPLLETAPDGPLFDQGTSRTIEVWTERELSGMHALSWIARRRARADVQSRLAATARWHVQHTQPDNATNRPWAAHVFLQLSFEHEDHDARLYAETLVHNCQTTHGVPDSLSGLILLDSADALREAFA